MLATRESLTTKGMIPPTTGHAKQRKLLAHQAQRHTFSMSGLQDSGQAGVNA